MLNIANAQSVIALRDMLDSPEARRIAETVAAISLIEDDAARKNAQQALALGVTAAAAHQMQTALADGQSGEFRDIGVDRDGALVARFTGGRSQTVERFGDRLIAETVDKLPLLPAS